MRGAVVLFGKRNQKSEVSAATKQPRNQKSEGGWLRFVPLLGIIGFLLMWHLLSLRYATFILPGPLDVLQKLGEKLRDGTLPLHIGVTLSAALPGLLIGTALAFVLGYPIAKSRVADRLLSPFIIASQGIPFVAIAPLLFIWFGTGLGSKLIVCALIVFFPIAINVITGIRSVPALWHDLFSAHRASPWQRFTAPDARSRPTSRGHPPSLLTSHPVFLTYEHKWRCPTMSSAGCTYSSSRRSPRGPG